MPDSATLATRCPACATAFRATREQLAARQGQVRCGRCQHVFDAYAYLVRSAEAPVPALSPPPLPAVEKVPAPLIEYSASVKAVAVRSGVSDRIAPAPVEAPPSAPEVPPVPAIPAPPLPEPFAMPVKAADDASDWREFDTILGRWLGSPLHRQVPWGVVLSGLVVYALVLGPGLRLLARRRHWLLVHGVLLAVVLLSTTAIAVLASRGFGAPPRAIQVVIATAAGPERWVLDRWLTVLEPAGGQVSWQVPGDGVWTGHADDAGLPLVATAGHQASLAGRVPPWGRRLLRQRGGVAGLNVQVQRRGAAIHLAGELPSIHHVWEWHAGAFTPLSRDDSDNWIASHGWNGEQTGRNAVPTLQRLRYGTGEDAAEVMTSTQDLLLARALGLPGTGAVPDPRHLILVWADLPEAWQLVDGREQPGRALLMLPAP